MRVTEEWLRNYEAKRNPHKPFATEPQPAMAKPAEPMPQFALTPTTDTAKLNKTEAAFCAYVKAASDWVGVQNITLKLADDCRYTPDFAAVSGSQFIFYEVKGFWRDDAKVKIKVAARLFPMFKFIVVTKDKSGWHFEDVKP